MTIVLLSLATLLVLLFLIKVRYSATRSLLEPGIIFSVNLILLYPVRAIVLYYFGEDALPDYPGAEIFDNIENAIFISLVGSVGYVFGYLLVMKKDKFVILDGKDLENDNNKNLVTIWVLFLFSIAGIAYKIATGDYMSYLLAEDKNMGLSHIATLLTSLQWPAYIGGWILWFKNRRDKSFLILFFCILLTVIPFQFLQGSKTFLSLLLVGVVVAYYWANARLPKMTAVFGVFVVVVFVFPFVTNFREYINSEYGKIPSLLSIDLARVNEFEELNSKKSRRDEIGLFKFSARYGGIDQLHGIAETVPTILGYRFGIEYSAFFVNLIPRAVWADKPIFSRGADYGSALGASTSITPFPIGEAYWDLGEYGTVVMMVIWGGCLAVVMKGYNYFYKRQNRSLLIAVYFLSQIYWISGGETSMPSVLSGLPQHAALLWFITVVIDIAYLRRNRARGLTENKIERRIDGI